MTVDFTGATWHKASASTDQAQCVEVAYQGGVYGVRDSKDPSGTVIQLTPAEWAVFVSGVREGGFD